VRPEEADLQRASALPGRTPACCRFTPAQMGGEVDGFLQHFAKHHITPKGWKRSPSLSLPGCVGRLSVLIKQSESTEAARSAVPVTVQSAVFTFLYFTN